MFEGSSASNKNDLDGGGDEPQTSKENRHL
jgi:hypothetical protein